MCPSPSWRGLSQWESPPALLLVLHHSSASARLSAAPLPSAATLPSTAPSLSPDALLCSPPSLLPFQIYSHRHPLLDRATDGEEKAESSRRRRGDGAIERNRRGDGRIERTRIRINEETAESRGHQHVHKATRRRLIPKASLERPDA